VARKQALPKLKRGLSAAWEPPIRQLRAFKPVAGCEEAWKRYVDATEKAREELSVFYQINDRIDADPDNKTLRALWKESGDKFDRLLMAELGALDKYRYQVRHINDDKRADEEEARELVIETLSVSGEGLQFTLGQGLVAAKVAQAIRNDIIEAEIIDPVFCSDCEED
jgi:hypothetical protein